VPEHADQPLPGLRSSSRRARLTSASTSSPWGAPWRKAHRALRAATAPGGPASTRARLAQRLLKAQLFGAPAQERSEGRARALPARFRRRRPGLGSKVKIYVDLVDDLAQERRGLEAPRRCWRNVSARRSPRTSPGGRRRPWSRGRGRVVSSRNAASRLETVWSGRTACSAPRTRAGHRPDSSPTVTGCGRSRPVEQQEGPRPGILRTGP
jgi:hypothetical protein